MTPPTPCTEKKGTTTANMPRPSRAQDPLAPLPSARHQLWRSGAALPSLPSVLDVALSKMFSFLIRNQLQTYGLKFLSIAFDLTLNKR